jgi:hypothetical protein
MLARAKAYIQTFLTLHGQDDGKGLKAKLQLAKVEKLLEKSGEPESPFVGPPRDVTADILAWAKKRDALPPQEQGDAILKKLTEANPGSTIKYRWLPIVENGKVVKLDVGDSKGLSNIAPLFGLKLNYLSLFRTAITHVEPLRGMPLENLDLAATNKLEGLKGLEGMPLQKLYVTESRITSLRPLRGAKLTYLDINRCHILDSLDGLQGQPITFLNAYEVPQLGDLEPIRGMKLETLQVSHCDRLTDLGPIRGMNLEFLGIAFCARLADISLIRGMPLKNLYINGHPVIDLSLLEGMPLREVSMERCKQLKTIQGVEKFPLEVLDLRETKFATKKVADDLKQRISTLRTVMIE